jgi:Uri superfamily endonuclease
MDNLPVQPGTYALILNVYESHFLGVGSLGMFEFNPGIYVYLGSARGPGGIRARLGRHLKGGDRLHWHIDYLKSVSVILGYGFVISRRDNNGCTPTECDWSQVLASLSNASIPVSKFGASDCNFGCPAHLIHFPFMETKELILPTLGHLNDKGGLNIRFI